MTYLVLARKYRPQTLEQVVGQNHVTQTLANAISAQRVAHAILLTGPRGTGKTTIARILAKAMNCENGPTATPCNRCRSCHEITNSGAVDVFEIDGASNNGVDQVRELRQNIRYMPSHSAYKIYIIDEVHMLSLAAFNALLKTLEEPPGHIMFIFATTEPQKIPITILSRCQRHDLRRIDNQAIAEHMAKICSTEGVTVDAKSLWLIAREASGCMRDALSLLDQIISCSNGDITQAEILGLLGIIDRELIMDTATAILDGDIKRILARIAKVYSHGMDLRKFYTDLIEHFRNLLVVKLAETGENLVDLPEPEIELLSQRVEGVTGAYLSQLLDLLFKEEATVRYSASPKLTLEMIFLRLHQIRPMLPIDLLIEKIETLRRNSSVAPTAASHGSAGALPDGRQLREKDRPILPDSISSDQGQAPKEPADGGGIGSKNGSSGLGADDPMAMVVAKISEKKPSLGAILSNCTLTMTGEDEVIVHVNANEFTANTLKRHNRLIEEACRKALGKPMTVALQTNIQDNNNREERKSRANRLRNDALAHPLVADAIELFDGKVVEVKIL
jgi:DNA polymerase-3 subunit gamma/tau